ncbi:hypothetical protein AMJ39_09760 [candidate division TA06 bacterium DG_24]|uniref:Histidine--tRNA ligase n=1 Tax=candidate division TA06 bacterium DG_24 TaxID=1703770 RepID=A0A0S7WMX0_UNCT6|nr:MAG: hypothetical protein AMJ39_09760 [candidate division TA06 bacterium DG_24]
MVGDQSGRTEPRLLRGFRDLMPDEMIARQRLISVVQDVYELYGFVPLDTPALEYADVLLGDYGEESNKQVYQFTVPEGDVVALRYDLTVPLARVVAQYRDLPRPFRRYQVAAVWRADKPGPGRFREFIQFDLDTVGSESMLADAEIISGMCDTLDALGVARYRIRISNRKLLNTLVAYAGIEAGRAHDVFRVLDKLDKVGLDAVKLELTVGRVDASGDPIPGLGLEQRQVARIEEFLALPQETRSEALDAVEDLFREVPHAAEGIEELRDIDRFLSFLSISDAKAAIDFSVARGLDYYTGPVFEALLLDAPKFGSIFAGGRYDGLVERFLGVKMPGTGASIGIDRLLAALQHLGAVKMRPSTASVLVTVMEPDRLAEYQAMTSELRQAGINTELYLGTETSLRKQLQYADRQKIPVAVIAGSEEFEAGTVSVKDLLEGVKHDIETKEREEWVRARFGQRTVPRRELVPTVNELLRAQSHQS